MEGPVLVQLAYTSGLLDQEASLEIQRDVIESLTSKATMIEYLAKEMLGGILVDIESLDLERKSKKHKKYVSLKSSLDFKELMRSLKVKNTLKLRIVERLHCRSTPSDDSHAVDRITVLGSQDDVLPISLLKGDNHEGVLCDNCFTIGSPTPICGLRYKCVICPNFDLCELCFSKRNRVVNHDASHPMLAVDNPHFLKSHQVEIVSSDGLFAQDNLWEQRASSSRDASTQEAIEIRIKVRGNSSLQLQLKNLSAKIVDLSCFELNISNFMQKEIFLVSLDDCHSLKPMNVAKFNVNVSNAHFKFPFHIAMSCRSFNVQSSFDAGQMIKVLSLGGEFQNRFGTNPDLRSPKSDESAPLFEEEYEYIDDIDGDSLLSDYEVLSASSTE